MSDRVLKRMMDDYCRVRISPLLPPREVEGIRAYLSHLIDLRVCPARRGGHYDWSLISQGCDVDEAIIRGMREGLTPALDSLRREIPKLPAIPLPEAIPEASFEPESPSAPVKTQPEAPMGEGKQKTRNANPKQATKPGSKRSRRKPDRRKKPGPAPRTIIEFPEPLTSTWEDPPTFQAALKVHMERHGDSSRHLHKALTLSSEGIDPATIRSWVRGDKVPRSVESFDILKRIERRYRLPEGYFRKKLPHPCRATRGFRTLENISPAERRRLAWHLPDDFDHRPSEERQEILDWVRRVIITGSTEYRLYQANAVKQRFSIRFPGLVDQPAETRGIRSLDPDVLYQGARSFVAPPHLLEEMTALISFKTSTLTAVGYQRIGSWGEETASQKLEHFGLMFGALVAPTHSGVRGFGAEPNDLSLALLVFPAVWDWYIKWREGRRGFFTGWEVDMLRIAQALTRRETGWLRQTPSIAKNLHPIAHLISDEQIAFAQDNWDAQCDEMNKFAGARAKEIEPVSRIHRDPFEPILPILEADSPVGEYRMITEEILRLMPDEDHYPLAAAECVRSFLMLRFGLHLGLRQKNLRQLLFCRRGETPATERQLADWKCGQMRWNLQLAGWEVFIPSIAFKNARSSYFGNKPFRLLLPDLGELYTHIEAYIDHHRARLLHGAKDPGTFFVKTVKTTSVNAAYDQNTFYEAWRLTIQRYGIWNPYTQRGVIEGLLPHGPHNVRDVLATHVLKQTGSYEQASYAIQDTPDMVAKHYGRFLPQDKAALAAQVLNKVWST